MTCMSGALVDSLLAQSVLQEHLQMSADGGTSQTPCIKAVAQNQST